jgi:hypothetical protein
VQSVARSVSGTPPLATGSTSAGAVRHPYAQSTQIMLPLVLRARRLRWCTRKQFAHVNSSACFGITRTVSSSPDRLAGSSKNWGGSASSMSIPVVDSSGRVVGAPDHQILYGVCLQVLVAGHRKRRNRWTRLCAFLGQVGQTPNWNITAQWFSRR